MKKVIKIGEESSLSSEERFRLYRETIDELLEMGYSFLHGMAKKDSGTLHSLAEWMIGSWMGASHSFDMDTLLSEVSAFLFVSFLFLFFNTLLQLSKEELTGLWQDCDRISAHAKEGRHRNTVPQSSTLDKVFAKFSGIISRTSLATAFWS